MDVECAGLTALCLAGGLTHAFRKKTPRQAAAEKSAVKPAHSKWNTRSQGSVFRFTSRAAASMMDCVTTGRRSYSTQSLIMRGGTQEEEN